MEEREERPSKGLDITRAPLPRYVNSEIEEEEMDSRAGCSLRSHATLNESTKCQMGLSPNGYGVCTCVYTNIRIMIMFHVVYASYR